MLIAEDEYFLADELVRAFAAHDLSVIGPFADERSALAVLDQTPVDFAVIDINLSGGPSFDLALELAVRQVPFVILTGYDKAMIPEVFRAHTVLAKPADLKVVIDLIHAAGASPADLTRLTV